MQGLAHGLDLPFDDVFAWNCRGDVWGDGAGRLHDGADPRPRAGHRSQRGWGSGLAGPLRAGGACGLADGRAFAAFVYPGSIPGHTFAVTETGIVQTVNNIRSRAAGIGLPRMVLGRAVLGCASLDEVIRTIETSARAGAFHFTLAQRGDQRLVSVEFTHARCSTVIVEQALCHANHLVHTAMAGEPQIVTASSAARQRRAMLISARPAWGRPDPLRILWDGADTDLPILREQPDDPDGENTLQPPHSMSGRREAMWQVYAARGGIPSHRLTAPPAGQPLAPALRPRRHDTNGSPRRPIRFVANEDGIARLVGALPLEQSDEYTAKRSRFMPLECAAG